MNQNLLSMLKNLLRWFWCAASLLNNPQARSSRGSFLTLTIDFYQVFLEQMSQVCEEEFHLALDLK